MIFSDLNFGMYPRDQEIAKYISDLQLKHGYPDFIYVSTGKNQKEKVINAIKHSKILCHYGCQFNLWIKVF